MDNRTIRLDAAKLIALRKARGLSRERLAEAAQPPHRLSVATIKRAERGDPVYLETARCLSRVLETPVQTLVLPGEASEARGGAPPDGLAVMVLPFRAASRDQGTDVFCHAMTEGLNQRLSAWWFPIIGHGTSLSYGAELDVRRIGEELDVSFVVTGSVQRLADRIEVRANLLRMPSQHILWSGVLRRSYAETFVLQDELANAVFEHIGYELLERAAASVRSRSSADLTGWERGILGSWHFYRRGPEANARAREYLLEAVRAEPRLDWVWYLLGLTYQQDVINGWGSSQAGALTELIRISKAFLGLHPRSPRARVLSAYASVYRGDRDGAREQAVEARELAPNSTAAYSVVGQTLAMGNEPDAAIEQFEMALRLSPRDQDAWSIHTALALAHFVAERYEDTLEWAERATSVRPDVAFPHGAVAVASAFLGDLPKAKRSLGRMLSLQPNPTREGFGTIVASTDPAIAGRYLEGLRRAGLPL